jgi:hypothetical protein
MCRLGINGLIHTVKMNSVFKSSAVASCACCLCTPWDRSADDQRVAYQWRSADYAQRVWIHAIELGHGDGQL